MQGGRRGESLDLVGKPMQGCYCISSWFMLVRTSEHTSSFDGTLFIAYLSGIDQPYSLDDQKSIENHCLTAWSLSLLFFIHAHHSDLKGSLGEDSFMATHSNYLVSRFRKRVSKVNFHEGVDSIVIFIMELIVLLNQPPRQNSLKAWVVPHRWEQNEEQDRRL